MYSTFVYLCVKSYISLHPYEPHRIHLHTSGYICTIYTFKKQSFIAALRNKSLKWSPTWGGRSHCRQGTRSCRSLAKACRCKMEPFADSHGPMPSMLHVSINSQDQLSFAEKPVGGWWRWVAKIVSARGQILVHVSWHGHHELNSCWFLGTSQQGSMSGIPALLQGMLHVFPGCGCGHMFLHLLTSKKNKPDLERKWCNM